VLFGNAEGNAPKARRKKKDKQLRLAFAAERGVDWFAKGLVSQGKAAELAGISRWEFLEELGRRHVPAINITVDDLREELRGILGEK
jgi:predicted HTH domain antitoxin